MDVLLHLPYFDVSNIVFWYSLSIDMVLTLSIISIHNWLKQFRISGWAPLLSVIWINQYTGNLICKALLNVSPPVLVCGSPMTDFHDQTLANSLRGHQLCSWSACYSLNASDQTTFTAFYFHGPSIGKRHYAVYPSIPKAGKGIVLTCDYLSISPSVCVSARMTWLVRLTTFFIFLKIGWNISYVNISNKLDDRFRS